jgi:hypothetical protein
MQPEQPKIFTAMANILKDVETIGKDRKADMGNAGKYNFRGIDDMYNSLHDTFAKHEVFIIPEILKSDLQTQEKESTYNGQTKKSLQYSVLLTIKFTFYTTDGSSVSAVGIGHALDTSDKATNKAQSSALKYALMQTFLIPTEEDKDVEVADNKVAPAKKPNFTQDNFEHAVKLIGEGKVDEARAYAAGFDISTEFQEALKDTVTTYNKTLKTN